MSNARIRKSGLAAALVVGATQPGGACTSNYVSAVGESLYDIAQSNLGDLTKWSVLLHANPHLAGRDILNLAPGTPIAVPCPDASVTVVEPVLTSAETPAETPARANGNLQVLTGRNPAHFTGQHLPQNGMVTELVTTALDGAPLSVSYDVTWNDGWQEYLHQDLTNANFDMAFPSVNPNCSDNPGQTICENLLFSDALINVPIMLFVRKDDQFQFHEDTDIWGKSICRPKGSFTHDLDTPDRNWLDYGLIELVMGESVQDCFAKVAAGEVDAASVNLFIGASTILDLDLRNAVVPLEQPVSQQGLHVVVPKANLNADDHLAQINAGLKQLRDDGRYQEIVTRHLRQFQEKLQ